MLWIIGFWATISKTSTVKNTGFWYFLLTQQFLWYSLNISWMVPPNLLTISFFSPQNSPQQSAIAEGFAEANSTFTVITSAKILLRWLFPTSIYIQFTIFNTYFSTKLSSTYKRYHLHVLEKCLYMLQGVRSIACFWQFIQPLSLRSHDNGTSFAFWSYIIVSVKFCDVTFLKNFYFVSFFYHLFICWCQRKIRLVTLSKSYLYKFFFWSFFLLKLTFNKTI